jgi:hypothetical protein
MRSGRWRTLVLAVLAYVAAVAVLFTECRSRTGGQFIYPLDDVYIHLTLARNVAQYGVFGVVPGEFGLSSSAPLWVLGIAAVFRLLGSSPMAPLVMAFASGLLVLLVAQYWLVRRGVQPLTTGAALLGITVFTPLPVLCLSGMEHLFHAALTICFAGLAAELLSADPWRMDRKAALALALAPVMTVIRFESALLIGVFGLLLMLRRRVGFALAVLAAGAAPVAVVSALCLAHGWLWLPNSVLLKVMSSQSSRMAVSGVPFALRGVAHLVQLPHIAVLVVAMFILYMWRRASGRGAFESGQAMLALGLLTTAAHLQVAQSGWFFRYEAYLVVLGVMALAWAWPAELAGKTMLALQRQSRWGARILAAAALFMFLVPLARRTVIAAMTTPRASREIYEQQYQMAQFLAAYYKEGSVAANDIGAITFFTSIRCLDLTGLANRAIGRRSYHGIYTTADMEAEAQRMGTQIAVVYDEWFGRGVLPKLPAAWRRVGAWRTPDPVVLGSDEVSFYAVAPGEADELERRLREFSPRLPQRVVQSGAYTRLTGASGVSER